MARGRLMAQGRSLARQVWKELAQPCSCPGFLCVIPPRAAGSVPWGQQGAAVGRGFGELHLEAASALPWLLWARSCLPCLCPGWHPGLLPGGETEAGGTGSCSLGIPGGLGGQLWAVWVPLRRGQSAPLELALVAGHPQGQCHPPGKPHLWWVVLWGQHRQLLVFRGFVPPPRTC